MTVKELIQELERLRKDAEVRFKDNDEGLGYSIVDSVEDKGNVVMLWD